MNALRLSLCLTVCAVLCHTAFGDIRYTITDLGNFGGTESAVPWAINESGQVAGEAFPNSLQHAYFHDGTSMIDLTELAGNTGTFGGAAGASYGLNDLGQVVGYGRNVRNGDGHASFWSPSTGMIDLGTLGGPNSRARAINNSGQVVGDADTPGGIHAFIWTAGSAITDLGALGGLSFARDINESGQVAGTTGTPAFVDRAFIWTAQTGMIDLGTLGGLHSDGYAINNRGQVVGTAATAFGDGNQQGHAFLWDPSSGMIDLGTLGGSNSTALAVNDDGWVVGNSGIPSASTVRAFVYDGSQMYRLDELVDPAAGWTFLDARGINDAGQIIVLGALPNAGMVHTLVLTPIPEPGGWLSLVLGGFALIQRRSRDGP